MTFNSIGQIINLVCSSPNIKVLGFYSVLVVPQTRLLNRYTTTFYVAIARVRWDGGAWIFTLDDSTQPQVH